jgi:hypothetical protein
MVSENYHDIERRQAYIDAGHTRRIGTLPGQPAETIVAPGIACAQRQSLNCAARFSTPAIIASFRSADMSMAAFQVAM